MAFFPKDEYNPRRGVAMTTRVPDVEALVGEHRDTKIAREVDVFVKSPFVLNKALDKNIPVINQVRTFDRRKGEHDVIVHTSENIPKPMPRLRPDLSDRALERLHYPHQEYQQDRNSAIHAMVSSPGLVQKLSKQEEEKFHKHAVPQPIRRFPSDGISGFNGIGKSSEDYPIGKQRVIKREYDPLRFKHPLRGEHGEPAVGIHHLKPEERPQGLGRTPDPYPVTAQEHFQYHDGLPLAMKRENRHPHVHKFPDNFTADDVTANMPGFQGMGRSDVDDHASGKKYIAPNDSIYTHFESYQGSPQAKHQQQLGQIEREQALRNSTTANGHLSEYHHNRYNGQGGAPSGAPQSPPPSDKYYTPTAHNSPAHNSIPQIKYQQYVDSTRHNKMTKYYQENGVGLKAPHRVIPLKPDTIANKSAVYHPSQSSIQLTPEPNRWMAKDAERIQFH